MPNVPPLCRPSAVYDDWVQKGFHIPVQGIELIVRPGHRRGMIVFKRFFRRDDRRDVDAAGRLAGEVCLPSETVRNRWVQTLGRAMTYLNGYQGDMAAEANGRKYEFRRLQKALLAYGKV